MTYTKQNRAFRSIDYSSLCRSYDCLELPSLLKESAIRAQSDDIQKICPDHLEDRFFLNHKKLSAHLKAIRNAGIYKSFDESLEMVPKKVVDEYCDIVKAISFWAIKNNEAPKNYNELSKIYDLIVEISQNKLDLEWRNVKKAHKKQERYSKIKESSKYVYYDMWKSSTGRLTTKDISFPILSLDKVYRPAIMPKNDFLVELDYNAAEIRTLLYLMGHTQPKEDIHGFLMKEIFPKGTTRQESKKKVFSWLYDGNKSDPELEKIFDRTAILNKYYDGESLYTPTNRHIFCDKYHALNYLIQGATSDMLLLVASKVSKILEDKKSYIYFTMHDSLVLDFSNSEQNLIKEIYEAFKETPFGDYKVNVSIGQNYGALKKL